MSNTVQKESRCNRCGWLIEWDRPKAEELFGKNKPFEPGTTRAHTCPTVNNTIQIAPGFEAMVAKSQQEYKARQGYGSGTNQQVMPSRDIDHNQTPSNTQQGEAAVSAIMGNPNVDTSIKIAIAELVRKVEDMKDELRGQYNGLDQWAAGASDTMVRMEKKIDEFIQYNPTERATLRMIEKLLTYLPEPLAEPKALSDEDQAAVKRTGVE